MESETDNVVNTLDDLIGGQEVDVGTDVPPTEDDGDDSAPIVKKRNPAASSGSSGGETPQRSSRANSATRGSGSLSQSRGEAGGG